MWAGRLCKQLDNNTRQWSKKGVVYLPLLVASLPSTVGLLAGPAVLQSARILSSAALLSATILSFAACTA